MKSFTVRSNRKQQSRQLFAYIGESNTIEYDFAPWETDNGSVTSVTWSTELGQAGITNESLASSTASATVTTNQEGKSLIKIAATAGNNTFATYLHVLSRDPKNLYNDIAYSDYY